MPSENTGNVITKISLSKDKVTIYLNKTKIEMSHDLYTSSYYYIGKELSDEDIEKIEKDKLVSEALKVGRNFAMKKQVTEWALRNKLYEKGFNKPETDEVVLILKKEKFIDDKAFIKEYVAYLNEKLYGQNKIIQELRLKGIFDENIKAIVFSSAKELKKAKTLLPKLEKQYASMSNVERKQHIYLALQRQGFTSDIVAEAMKKIKNNSEKEESNQLRRDFAITLDKGVKKYREEKGLMEYVFRSLTAKGYKRSEIKSLWEKRAK